MSLWDADQAHLWHRCFNCYSKAIMYSHEDVLTLGGYVYENFYAAPVDWLVDDYGGGRGGVGDAPFNNHSAHSVESALRIQPPETCR